MHDYFQFAWRLPGTLKSYPESQAQAADDRRAFPASGEALAMNEQPSPEDDIQELASAKSKPCELCWEMSGELKDIVSWLAEGELTPKEFAHTVTALEKRKLTRLGFTLSSAVSEETIVHFSLRFADTGELCASMDVNPQTGDIQVQPACA